LPQLLLHLLAMAFVATTAPAGWKPGRWSQTSQGTWQEEKLDDPSVVYQFKVVNGPSGTNTVRLKMDGQNTEVLLLDSSAQIFVKGCYLGEYGGAWQAAATGGRKSVGGGSKQAPGSKQVAPALREESKQSAPPAVPSRADSKKPEFEQTLAPAQVEKAAKSAPPPAAAPERKASNQAAPERKASNQPVPQAETRTSSAPRFEAYQPPAEFDRPCKAAGLDKSDKSMQKLIDAAKNGDVAKVKACLDEGIDPDGPAKDGKTPLMAAASGGHLAAVEALLAAYADPTLGKGDETPLTIAFQKGKQDILKVLFNASFTTLNGQVMPGTCMKTSDADVRSSNQDVPDNAAYELKSITTMIAHGANRPDSPAKGSTKKYGNYSHLAVAANPEEDEQNSDMLKQASVRMHMKNMAASNRDTFAKPRSP